jgi:hypothetical protein
VRKKRSIDLAGQKDLPGEIKRSKGRMEDGPEGQKLFDTEGFHTGGDPGFSGPRGQAESGEKGWNQASES